MDDSIIKTSGLGREEASINMIPTPSRHVPSIRLSRILVLIRKFSSLEESRLSHQLTTRKKGKCPFCRSAQSPKFQSRFSNPLRILNLETFDFQISSVVCFVVFDQCAALLVTPHREKQTVIMIGSSNICFEVSCQYFVVALLVQSTS